MPSLEANQLLAAAVDAADSRKAEDIRILALDPSESALTDYFLICNGTNERQNAAIADEIEGRLKREFGTYPNSVEGRRQGEWILMDYVDFVVHIFMPEKRAYYGLERLRKSARNMTAEDLNADISQAIKDARKKTPVPVAIGEETSESKRGGKTGRKTSSRVAEALTGTVTIAEEEAPKKAKAGVKKAAAKKAAARKSAAKRNVTPQPAARKGTKKVAGKSSEAKTTTAKKTVK